MANNVSFLLGSQANLNDLITNASTAKNIQAGAFYLTNDSHRLYYGQDATTLVALNEGITTVDNVAALPSLNDKAYPLIAGQFYYAKEENILCIYNGQDWVQINPDTMITDIEHAVEKAGNNVSVTTKLNDGSILSSDFGVNAGTNVSLTVDANGKSFTINGTVAAISSAVANNVATITLTDGSGSSNVKLTAGDNVSITGSANNTIISSQDFGLVAQGTTTVVGTDDVSVTLTVKDNSDATASTTFHIVDDATTTHVSTASGKVKVESRAYDIDASATNNVASINLNSTLTGTDGKQTDTVKIAGGANVKSITANNDTITIDTHDSYLNATGTVTANPAGGYTVELSQTGGNDEVPEKVSFGFDPIIHLSPSNADVHFLNGAATLDVYTKKQVDDAIATGLSSTVNPMTYKGQKASKDSLPTSSVEIGDVWMISAEHTAADGHTYKKGDLFIATGTEGADGYITAATLKWDYVPAGDDVDVYSLNMDGHGVTLNNGQGTAGQWHLAEGAKIKLNTVDGVTTIAHDTISITPGSASLTLTKATDTAGTSATLAKVISDVQYDSYGHITGFKEGTISVVDTHANLDKDNSSLKASIVTGNLGTLNNSADIIGTKKTWTQTIKDTDGYSVETTWGVAVDTTNCSLALKNDTSDVATIQLVWGTF